MLGSLMVRDRGRATQFPMLPLPPATVTAGAKIHIPTHGLVEPYIDGVSRFAC